jgi:hypothetical protein
VSKLDQRVFVVEDGRVVEKKIADFDGFIDETTTPRGVAPRYHVRGTELWSWGHQGNFSRCVDKFDTEAEAEDALEGYFLMDYWACPDICAYKTREGAEASLQQEQGGDT